MKSHQIVTRALLANIRSSPVAMSRLFSLSKPQDSQIQQLQQQQQLEKQQCCGGGGSLSLDDCLKLLRGERDEQRLAGLLLVTKFCRNDDHSSLRYVYDAVGSQFVDRLLRTGMGKGLASSCGEDNRDAYLQLSITVLAAFCRVPEISSSEEMAVKIPLILEILSNGSGSPFLEECYEFLYLTSAGSEKGVRTLYESGGMKVIASQMSCLPDGSRAVELAMKLMLLMLSNVPLDILYSENISEISMMVVATTRQFAMLHNALKFEALHLLSAIFSSDYLVQLLHKLHEVASSSWPDHIRNGVVDILQNRVAPAHKLQALILAESVVSIMGERWLIDKPSSPDLQKDIPADRCLILVLEASRVEIAVLLNELAYLKYEASQSTSSTNESVVSKQRSLAIAFSLVERIIKLISSIDEQEGHSIDESTFTKVINGLNETINVVLEYLNVAKEHGQKKGNDLLASVKIVASYLAETPIVFKQRINELLDYMLSVEGEDEPSPFHAVCFLLPLLCQITMNTEGSKSLVSLGGYKAVVECLIKLIGPNNSAVEDNGCIFLACDTIMNLLLKEKLRFLMDETTNVNLLKVLAYWTENDKDRSVLMIAASICALIFDYTSEEALVNHPNFDSSTLEHLYQLISRSLASCGQDMTDADTADVDLYEIISSGYSRWAQRFPHMKAVIER